MATMLDCKKIQPRISEFIDGDLDGDASWAIKLHLASCAVCSVVASDLTRTAAVLRDLPALEPSSGFEAALARRLADKVLQPRVPSVVERFTEWWTQPRLRPVFASAAAFAAVVPVAFLVGSHSGASEAARHSSRKASAPAPVASDPTLDDMWNEHLSYTSSEPLADNGGMLQTQSGSAARAVSGQTL